MAGVFFLLSGYSLALEITHFQVPKFVDRKEGVELQCVFQLGEFEQLHSVKWYRTDYKGHMLEFYAYQPKRNPPAKTYKLPGIKVDVSTLRDIGFATRQSNPDNVPSNCYNRLPIWISGPTLSQLLSFKVSGTMFLNYIKAGISWSWGSYTVKGPVRLHPEQRNK